MTANASLSSIRVVSATGQAVTGVGKYRYIGMLAEGGMADVFLAVTQNSGFEKLVVIKQLRPSLAEDPSFVAMFMDEARLAARLNHPNVVQTLEVGTDEVTGLHFIAMEFLEGVAHVRFARLKERVPPPLAFHLRILVESLRGLHYAHELRDFDGKPLNVVHRDVSPQNVMLTWAGGVKVLDFGIAKAALAAEKRPEDFKGKLEYMAPEQACREEVDRRADVFSVGVMLHEALTRRRLFRKGDDKLEKLVSGDLPRVLDVAPTTPKRLAEICETAMAHDREARYPTADAMADALEDWLGETTQHVSARDVGSYVADKFASTRGKITAAIEKQLALFHDLETSPDTKKPFAHLPPADFSAFAFRGLGGFDTIPPGAPGPGGFPMSERAGSTFPMSERSSAAFPLPGSMPSLPSFPPPPPASAAPAARSSGLLVGLLLGAGTAIALGAGGLGALFVLHGRVLPSWSTPTTPTPVAAANAETVTFTIRAVPPDAKIRLDGTPVSNPATGTRPRAPGPHVVRIEAPGYEPREESITFEQSVLLALDLHPITPVAEPSATASGRKSGKPPRGGRP